MQMYRVPARKIQQLLGGKDAVRVKYEAAQTISRGERVVRRDIIKGGSCFLLAITLVVSSLTVWTEQK